MCLLVVVGLVTLVFIIRMISSDKIKTGPPPEPGPVDGPPDVIIVGAGIAGASLASVLARQGRRVTLIDRDFAVGTSFAGEYLQSGAFRALMRMDLDHALNEIDSVRQKIMYLHDDKGKELFPLDIIQNPMSHTFHHGRLAKRLRDIAMENERVKGVEGWVTELIQEEGVVKGVRYKLKGSEEVLELRAPLTVVANGKQSRFRKDFSKSNVVSDGGQAGLHMKMSLIHDTRHGIGRIIDCAPGYIIMYRLCKDWYRALVDVPSGYITDLPTTDKFLMNLLHSVPEHLKPAFVEAVEARRYDTVGVKYGPTDCRLTPGGFLLGDILNARHPLVAGGMGNVLRDVELLHRILQPLDFKDVQGVQTAYKSFLRHRRHHAAGVNAWSYIMHHVNANPNVYVQKLNQGILTYFSNDGFRKDALNRLLTATNTGFVFTLKHMILGMLYGVFINFQRQGVTGLPRSLFDTPIMLYKACTVVLPVVRDEVKAMCI